MYEVQERVLQQERVSFIVRAVGVERAVTATVSLDSGSDFEEIEAGDSVCVRDLGRDCLPRICDPPLTTDDLCAAVQAMHEGQRQLSANVKRHTSRPAQWPRRGTPQLVGRASFSRSPWGRSVQSAASAPDGKQLAPHRSIAPTTMLI